MHSAQPIRIAIPEIGQNMQNYVNAVRGVGADPVIISVLQKNTVYAMQQEYLDISDFQAENYDGMLIPGGVDVEPWRYGEKVEGSVGMDPALDALQLEVLKQCVDARIPVFGICRGHQIINVFFGGSLIQDLPTAAVHARKLTEPDKVHFSRTEEKSWLREIYGEHFAHNSAHHQAVKKLGTGLVVDQYSDEDHVVEAMHHATLPVYSVQWHPERMCFENARPDTVDGSEVLQWFVALCKKGARKRFEEHSWKSGI